MCEYKYIKFLFGFGREKIRHCPCLNNGCAAVLLSPDAASGGKTGVFFAADFIQIKAAVRFRERKYIPNG